MILYSSCMLTTDIHGDLVLADTGFVGSCGWTTSLAEIRWGKEENENAVAVFYIFLCLRASIRDPSDHL